MKLRSAFAGCISGLAALPIASDARAGNVLVLGDGDADATVQAALSAAGHVVTISPVLEFQYDGTNPSPASLGNNSRGKQLIVGMRNDA